MLGSTAGLAQLAKQVTTRMLSERPQPRDSAGPPAPGSRFTEVAEHRTSYPFVTWSRPFKGSGRPEPANHWHGPARG